MQWALLASLSELERKHVLASATRRRYQRGEVIVHEGDLGDSLHLIATGRVSICVGLRSGETAMLNILKPGDFFGELTLVRWGGRRRRTATVVALEPTETMALTHDAWVALCAQFPAVEQLLVASLATRIEQLSAQLLESMYVGLDRRVYRCLVRMLETYGTGQRTETIPLTQDQIADLVGGSRPSVNQVLRRLADQGLVALARGRLVVLEPEALRSKAGL